jgi:malate dehydrogenase (oxaloacetate-decarboxylating)
MCDAGNAAWRTGSPGSFTKANVKEMAAYTERPIIFALSNPRAQPDANPTDLIAWTDGHALIATGSPFPPVTFSGVTYVVAQVNNARLYSGLSPGAAVSRASRIGDGMLGSAAVESADAEGPARFRFTGIVQQVQHAMWQPEYRRIHAS